MSKEKRLVPIRRFTKFKNNWKQHRLEEIVSFLKGRNLSWSDIHEEGVNECILYGNLYTDYGMVIQNINYSTNTSVLGKILSKFGDVLIPSSDTTPTGLARASSLEKDNVILGGDINVLRPKSDINGSFLSYNINYNRKQLLKLIKGTTVKHIYNSDLKDVKIKSPSLEEQKHLTRFFKTMDNLINLQQQKITKLKDLKSAYLNDMFPKEGESVPKLRFAGFEEPWEKCKISDIFKITRGHVLAAKEVKDNKNELYSYPVYSSQTTENGLMGYYNKYLYENAITWTTDGANAGTVTYRGGKFYCTNVSGVLLSDKSYANKLIAEILNKEAWKHVSKVGNPKLMNNVMAEINITIPKSAKEQELGSNFFDYYDDLISIEKHKLEKLKQMKQAYLNEMFV